MSEKEMTSRHLTEQKEKTVRKKTFHFWSKKISRQVEKGPFWKKMFKTSFTINSSKPNGLWCISS